jgi:hypothetical protein
MRSIFLLLLSTCILCSCFSRSTLMSREDYDNVQLGTSISQVTSKVGSPYAVHSRGGSIKEYEYIEKLTYGSTIPYENHYFILVSNGQVVGKRMSQERLPDYDLIYQEDPNHNTYPYYEVYP